MIVIPFTDEYGKPKDIIVPSTSQASTAEESPGRPKQFDVWHKTRREQVCSSLPEKNKEVEERKKQQKSCLWGKIVGGHFTNS